MFPSFIHDDSDPKGTIRFRSFNRTNGQYVTVLTQEEDWSATPSDGACEYLMFNCITGRSYSVYFRKDGKAI